MSLATTQSYPVNPLALEMTAIIHAARAGDESAFCNLCDTYRAAAERVARHILRTEEAAADAVQDALIKVYKAIPNFEDGNFRAWLLRIVTNTCYDHLRRQKRRPALSLDALLEESYTEMPDTRISNDPEHMALRGEQRDFLRGVIAELSPWHKEVVVLVDVMGYDYAEAAAVLGLPLGTVKSRLSRARANLRDRLTAANYLPGPVRH
ncbi:MAG: sigma-70 family RNA polymerase sigma factor [Caldilineaceae bacterium]|nr:sigma-70 family RNA polymerase sigma factor [Caldilineaceae bacterium]